VDTEAKSHGSGGRVLLYIYFLGCATALLFQAATGTGFDAAGASIVVGAGGGLVMALVGLAWEWAAPIIWPNIETERGSVAVYRGAAGLYGTHAVAGHPLLSGLILTLLFGILKDDLAAKLPRGAPLGTVGLGLGMVVCLGGAVPTIVLQTALVQVSWQQGAAWLCGAMLQYGAGGLFIGQVYFTPDCTPHCDD